MSVEIKGMEELQKAIADAYSGADAKKIRKEALNVGGDVMVERLKEKFDTFKATGYSEAEIMRSDARTKNDIEELKVGWDGPHDRWRLIHLTEFGYTRKGKQYTPKGFGAIQKTIELAKAECLETVSAELRKRL